jgi:nicotinamide-nucleotide amidase
LFYTHQYILSELRTVNIIDHTLIDIAFHLGQILKAQGDKIATAESCTGGLIAAIITEIPGSSLWFDRGFVTYSNQAKIDLLNVNSSTLADFGAVSAETAQAMALGALSNSQSAWALAVTGIAGPDGGSQDKPVGTVFFGWCNRNGFLMTEKRCFTGDRHAVRMLTASHALTKLSELLMRNSE